MDPSGAGALKRPWLKLMGRENQTFIAVERAGSLFKFLTECLEAYKERTAAWAGDENPDQANVPQRLEIIHGLIFDLSGKVETFMATQEERLRAIAEKIPAIQAGVDRIQAELATLKANNPDLEDELAAIEAAVGAVHDDVNPPAPAPAPAEGGSETP